MQIELTDSEDPALRAAILAPLRAHNVAATGRADPGGTVAILLRDDAGAVEGGMWALHWMGWLKLEFAYLPAHLRGDGLGSRMLASLEHAALARGCTGVWMSSFSIQAPGFYEKNGYVEVGRNRGRLPGGGDDVFLAKGHGLGARPASLPVIEQPDLADKDRLRALLVAWTNDRVGAPSFRNLAVLVRGEAGEILGGLWGYTGRDWLYIDLFGLPPALRKAGLGSRLMHQAMAEAKARGCVGVSLDTFSFQARPFYEKLGFSVFGQIDDYPAGHSRFFLRRML